MFRRFGELFEEAGTVPVRLRFPGQYADSGLVYTYNWNRFYGPIIGRYVESDAFGLTGGLNVFAYANGNPVRWTRPTGLLTVRCWRPLGDKTGKKPNEVFNHTFDCVLIPGLPPICDSTNAPDTWKPWHGPVPGVPSNTQDPEDEEPDDSYDPDVCKPIHDDGTTCVERCLLGHWANKRPDYDVNPWTPDAINRFEYGQSSLADCIDACETGRWK